MFSFFYLSNIFYNLNIYIFWNRFYFVPILLIFHYISYKVFFHFDTLHHFFYDVTTNLSLLINENQLKNHLVFSINPQLIVLLHTFILIKALSLWQKLLQAISNFMVYKFLFLPRFLLGKMYTKNLSLLMDKGEGLLLLQL